jgi:adenosylcobinamide kinase / adenosylcobinamide-phosphate guanylyltransferase
VKNNSAKKVILLLGGARSGKSSYAESLAKNSGEKVLFVATAEAGDEDMRLRIQKHRLSRPPEWRTLEAASDIGSRIADEIDDEKIVIIDCVTLLVSNILCRLDAQQLENVGDADLERQVAAEIEKIQDCLRKTEASFIIVSNEVGLGLVPDNRLGRLYRDLLGRANQMLAQSSDEVFFMVAGIPLRVKS